ncbi:MAG TPA: GNAT family N-acetyltransferase [Candidatus Dormibacteraeota bacterium]|nr:GNAT family N-acetyltransferase [Candidatus Dormibacteraeota bacterium]
MTQPAIRPMLPEDVDPSIDMITTHDGDVSREFLAFATSQAACVPMVAETDGTIVGTGVGTLSGSAGWIGTIFLVPAWRGQGIGRVLTQAVIDRLESAGARTLVLVATAAGRRLYSRMGFEVQTRYRILEAPGLAARDRPAPTAGPSVRPFEPGDLVGMAALDRAGTGEDRRHILERFATTESARVLARGDGSIDAFVVRAPWGGGATVARSPEAAAAIIMERRLRSGPDGRVRVGLLQENADGLARLADAGFSPSWSAPRMIRGDALDWHPDWIWGQFNHAIG